jgi:hypothetical protein
MARKNERELPSGNTVVEERTRPIRLDAAVNINNAYLGETLRRRAVSAGCTPRRPNRRLISSGLMPSLTMIAIRDGAAARCDAIMRETLVARALPNFRHRDWNDVVRRPDRRSGRIAITFLSGPKETLWWQLVTCSTH